MGNDLVLPDGHGGWRNANEPRAIQAGSLSSDPVIYFTTAKCYVVRIPITVHPERAFDEHMPLRNYFVREHGGNQALQAAAAMVNPWERKHAGVAPNAPYPKAEAGNWIVITLTYAEYRDEFYQHIPRWPHEMAMPAGAELTWPQGEPPPLFTYWTDTAEHSGEYAGSAIMQVGADGKHRPATSNDLPEVEIDPHELQ